MATYASSSDVSFRSDNSSVKMASAMIALRDREILGKIMLCLVGDDKGINIINNAEDPEAPRRISVSQPSDILSDVLNFAVVVNTYLMKEFIDFTVINQYRDETVDAKNKSHNRRLGEWYRHYNHEYRPITRLPEELLSKVLDSLTIKPPKLLDTHHRASLSVDSFASTAASLDQDSAQIRQFRLVCHRFAGLGRGRLLLRVRIRFSSDGFNTLREISENEDFRGSVKQFSYMIPRFYPSGKRRYVGGLSAADIAACRYHTSRTQAGRGTSECRRLKAEISSQGTRETGTS